MVISVCNQTKLLFNHNLKCAGTSVEDWIKSHSTDIKMGLFWNYSMDLFKDYHKFTVVRNPWDRMVSYYFWICREKEKQREEIRNKNREHFTDFETFLNHPESWLVFETWIPNSGVDTLQQTYITDTVDTVLRFENLEKDFKVIQTEYNCFDPLPILNTTDHKHYREYYNDSMINIVSEHFKRDIEEFNYDF